MIPNGRLLRIFRTSDRPCETVETRRRFIRHQGPKGFRPRQACTRPQIRIARLDQVPPVAVNVLEDGDDPVRLGPRRLDEADTLAFVSGVISREVVRFQKQEHATATLIADCNALPLPFCLGRKQAGTCASAPAIASATRCALRGLPEKNNALTNVGEGL